MTSHVYATYQTVFRADEMWLNLRNIFGHRQRSPHISSSIKSIFSALGDDPWIIAVGWDVMLSALTVGIWTIVNDVQTMDVLKCAVWPLAPETLEVVEVAAGKAKLYFDAAADAVDPYVAASRRVVEREAEAVRGVLRDLDTEAVVDGAKRGVGTGVETGRRALSDAYECLKKDRGGEADEHEDIGSSGHRDFLAASYGGSSGNLSTPKLRGGGGRAKRRDYVGEDEKWEEPQRGKPPRSPSKRRGRPPKAQPGEENTRTPSRSRSGSRAAVDRHMKSAAPSLERRGSLSRRRASASAAAATRGSVSQLKRDNLSQISAEVGSEGAEAAGLSWVLFLVGGLGMLSAGVLGAEGVR